MNQAQSPVLFTVEDGRRRSVELREGVWQHVVERHPEMAGEEDAVARTVADPDLVVRPHARAKGRGVERRINCRLNAHSRYNQLYVWVPIDYGPDKNWIVTAYLSPLPPKGDILYVRLPSR